MRCAKTDVLRIEFRTDHVVVSVHGIDAEDHRDGLVAWSRFECHGVELAR